MAEGRCRVSLGKLCHVPTKPPRTTDGVAQIPDVPITSTVVHPISHWVRLRCVPWFGCDFLQILRCQRHPCLCLVVPSGLGPTVDFHHLVT